MGSPLERIVKMGAAMLEAVRTFKPPSSDGKKFEIRLGQLIDGPLYTHGTTTLRTGISIVCCLLLQELQHPSASLCLIRTAALIVLLLSVSHCIIIQFLIGCACTRFFCVLAQT